MVANHAQPTTPIDRVFVREVAVAADVVEHTVWQRLRGKPVRGRAGDKTDRALRARGVEPGVLAEASPR